jgi:hypothetical protein
VPRRLAVAVEPADCFDVPVVLAFLTLFLLCSVASPLLRSERPMARHARGAGGQLTLS